MRLPTLRRLCKQPAEAALAIAALALGIGLTTMLFSVLKAVAWSEPPFPDSARLIRIDLSPDQTAVLEPQFRLAQHVAGVVTGTRNVVAGSFIARAPVAYVSPSFFNVLGIHPAIGVLRVGNNFNSAVISHQLWRDAFALDPAVLTKQVTVGGRKFNVTGVMPDGFAFPSAEQLWIAWDYSSQPPLNVESRGSDSFIVAKLRAQDNVKEARAAVNTIWRRTQIDRHIPVAPGVVGVSSYRDLNAKGEVKLLFSGILVACVLVLLIACLNVANLSLARAARRTHELAVRSALGASRNHIIWVLLKENLVNSFCAALIGIALSGYGLAFFESAIKRESQLTGGAIPWFHVGIDGWVLLFVAVLVIATALAAGMFPAWRASQIEVEPVLRDGARITTLGSTRFRHLLVNVQIAGSIVLVVASALMGSVALKFQSRLQYDPARLLSGRVSIDRASAGPQRTAHDIAAARTLERIQNSLEKVPGADAVAWTSAEHIERAAPATVELEGASGGRTIDNPATQWQVIAGSYFGLFSANALHGRLVDGRDTARSTRVAVVNTTFAQRCWPGGAAIGKRFRLSGGPHSSDWLQVVGVIPDMGSLRPAQRQLGPMVYLPISQNPVSAMSFLIKTRSDPRALIPAVRQAIAIVDPQLPVFELFTGSEVQELECIGFRLPTILVALCGLSALCLAIVGVYGILSLTAKERTREMGIRMALGADRPAIMRMLVWQYGRSVALATIAGIILSFLAARFLASLFGKFSGEIMIVTTVCILMSTVAFAAVLIPSRAAARTSPLEALRID